MNQICIAKKNSFNNTEFLDFALDDDDKLIVFSKFKEASQYLKNEVGQGEQLLDYIVTTIDAQKDNPLMKEILERGVTEASSSADIIVELSESDPLVADNPTLNEMVNGSPSEVLCSFFLDCNDFEIKTNDSIFEKSRTSLMMSSKVRDEFVIVFNRSCCISVSGL